MEWINPKDKKPELGSKVLVKIQYPKNIDYNVAIFAKSGMDKRVKGFFQNFDNHLLDGLTMKYDAWMYSNVVGWKKIEE